MKPKTKRIILQSACEELSRNPGARLEELILASGISRATYFRYFKDRGALDIAADQFAIESLTASLSLLTDTGSSLERFQEAVRVLVRQGYLAKYLYLFREVSGETGPEPIAAALTPIFTLLTEEGIIDPDIPDCWVDEVVGSLVYASWTGVVWGNVTPEEASRLLVRTILRGLSK